MGRSSGWTAFIAGVFALTFSLLNTSNAAAQGSPVDAAISSGYDLADDVDVASGRQLGQGLWKTAEARYWELRQWRFWAQLAGNEALVDRLDWVLDYLGDSLDDAEYYGEGYDYEPDGKYASICSAYGTGFFYIPGTDTCLKIGGSVRLEAGGSTTSIRSPTFIAADIGAGGLTNRLATPGSSSGGQIGVTTDVLRFYRGIAYNPRQQTEYGQLRSYVALRTGFIGSLDDKTSFTGSNLNAVPQGMVTGSNSLQWTIPVWAVFGIPVPNIPSLTAEIYGGVNISRREAKFTVTELGAADTPAFGIKTNWTSVDPALGAGLQYNLGNGFSAGVSATIDWANSTALRVASPNFPGNQFYDYVVGKRTEIAVRANLGWDLSSSVTRMQRNYVP